jgi:hypothetical protein
MKGRGSLLCNQTNSRDDRLRPPLVFILAIRLYRPLHQDQVGRVFPDSIGSGDACSGLRVLCSLNGFTFRQDHSQYLPVNFYRAYLFSPGKLYPPGATVSRGIYDIRDANHRVTVPRPQANRRFPPRNSRHTPLSAAVTMVGFGFHASAESINRLLLRAEPGAYPGREQRP